jgi:hypothetical protein
MGFWRTHQVLPTTAGALSMSGSPRRRSAVRRGDRAEPTRGWLPGRVPDVPPWTTSSSRRLTEPFGGRPPTSGTDSSPWEPRARQLCAGALRFTHPAARPKPRRRWTGPSRCRRCEPSSVRRRLRPSGPAAARLLGRHDDRDQETAGVLEVADVAPRRVVPVTTSSRDRSVDCSPTARSTRSSVTP